MLGALCEVHRPVHPVSECPTLYVLEAVKAERARQVAQYGDNADLQDGTGPETAWLLPIVEASRAHFFHLSPFSAKVIQILLRQEYEDYVEETGKPTWLHLVREEVAEAFQEKDPAKLRAELVQVAALCVSWIEKIDARKG